MWKSTVNIIALVQTSVWAKLWQDSEEAASCSCRLQKPTMHMGRGGIQAHLAAF